MVTAQTVFDIAMALMDELSSTGSATSSDTTEYKYRTPAILNMLVAEWKVNTGDTGSIIQLESLDDYIMGVKDSFCLSALPYGLAANLLIDENPTAAGFYSQRYEETRDRTLYRTKATIEQIEDSYGGIEMCGYSRW